MSPLLALCAFTLYALVSHSTGILVEREAPPGRALAIGLAVWAQGLLLLGMAGMLRALPIVLFAGGVVIARMWLRRTAARGPVESILPLAALAPAGLLCLYPPRAFDETLYHLPFVQAFAESGSLPFLRELRFPVFPQLQEILSVPSWLVAGELGPHVISFLLTVATALLLVEWGVRHRRDAGLLAGAFYCGSPIVVLLGATLYVEPALTLFTTAAFERLDRARTTRDPKDHFAAGAFIGTACGVKYLAGWFALCLVACALIFLRGSRFRAVMFVGAAAMAAALPTWLRLISASGNPIFPFGTSLFGQSAWALSPGPAATHPLVSFFTTAWDVTFARHRVNQQPPFTPWFIPVLLLMFAAALRSPWARASAVITVGYLALFTLLPADSRYLVPLLPLVAIAAFTPYVSRLASASRPAIVTAALLLALPAPLYSVYRLRQEGAIPMDARSREAYLIRRVPSYEALAASGGLRLYGCGTERLKYFAGDRLIGDYNGPDSYAIILGGYQHADSLAQKLRSIGRDAVLVDGTKCLVDPRTLPGFESRFTRAYRDRSGAEVWALR